MHIALPRKLIVGKVLFAIALCLIVAYLTLEKPGNHLVNKPALISVPTSNLHQDEQLKEQGLKDAQQTQLHKRLTQVSSARKSQADRPLMTESGGDLTLSPAITRYFEYFYSVHSQFSSEELLKLFSYDVKQHYPANFHEEIIRLFTCFLGYKKTFASILHEMDDHDVSYIMSHSSNFHAFKFSIQQAFFSAEEIHALFTDYENQLKAPSNASIKQLKYQAYQQAKKEGLPATMYDGQTQQRLASLEQQRDSWRQRLNDYSQQRDAITRSDGLDAYGKQQAVNALLDRLFDAREAMRVSALERGGML